MNPSLPPITPQRRAVTGFLTAIPIATLGGLIGLGGAEFRLPVLVGPLRYPAKQAVPLNLAVSLVTIIVSLIIRGRILTPDVVIPYAPVVVSLIVAAVISAFIGAGLVTRLSELHLERIIVILLFVIGCALLIESFLPQSIPALLPDNTTVRIIAGIGFGIVIGLVSSLLGVAGGELIIPTLIFAYGVDIKLAGTLSLLVSLPTIITGISRMASRGAYQDRQPLKDTVLPMGLGSIIGAIIGGLLVGIVPAQWLKLLLGIILIVSALRIFQHQQSR